MRFPEFSGEWKIFSLGDLCSEFQSGKGIKANSIKENAPYPVYGGNGLRGYSDFYNHDGDYSLIGRQGAKCGNVRLVSGRSYITEHAIAIKANSKNNTEFLTWLLVQMNLGQYSDQSAQPGLAVNKLVKLKAFVPDLNEQTKIARLLTLLNNRIVVQNKVIEKLKSLMRGMNDALMDNPCWENVPVGDFMDFYSTNSISWEQLSYEDGLIKNLHYGLIHVGLPTIVDCKKTPLPYIQNDNIPSQYTNCKNGDVAFADASEDTAEIGKVIELDNIDDLDIICGLHTIHGRDVKNRTVIGFKGFAFNSKYFHDQVRRLAQGSKVFSINTDNIKSCFLYIPNIEEQKKIVGIMRCMQDKIEAEEQILHIYERQRQYLLKQMFI